MTALLLSADSWRVAAAVVSVVVLFLLTAGITFHADELSRSWRVVLWAVVVQQAANAYLHVTRALEPANTIRDDAVDLPLVGILVSVVLLTIAVAAVFVDEAPRHDRRRRVRVR